MKCKGYISDTIQIFRNDILTTNILVLYVSYNDCLHNYCFYKVYISMISKHIKERLKSVYDVIILCVEMNNHNHTKIWMECNVDFIKSESYACTWISNIVYNEKQMPMECDLC